MADNSQIKQHVSLDERNRWDKVVDDFGNHLGAGGTSNHKLGDGTVPGFSTNDYTNAEKAKVASMEEGALNNPHPATHPYTMITGLSTVAHTGKYSDLLGIPETFKANGGDSDTVGGIRFTVGTAAPSNPVNDKDVWFDTANKLVKVYTNNAWVAFNAVYA